MAVCVISNVTSYCVFIEMTLLLMTVLHSNDYRPLLKAVLTVMDWKRRPQLLFIILVIITILVRRIITDFIINLTLLTVVLTAITHNGVIDVVFSRIITEVLHCVVMPLHYYIYYGIWFCACHWWCDWPMTGLTPIIIVVLFVWRYGHSDTFRYWYIGSLLLLCPGGIWTSSDYGVGSSWWRPTCGHWLNPPHWRWLRYHIGHLAHYWYPIKPQLSRLLTGDHYCSTAVQWAACNGWWPNHRPATTLIAGPRAW